MRNLGLVFFFIVAELFLQGCIPATGCSILIRGKDRTSLNTGLTDGEKADVLNVIQLTGEKYGYTQEPAYDQRVQMKMAKKHENHRDIVYVCYEKNIVKVDIGELGTRTMSQSVIEFRDELIKILNSSYSVTKE